MLTDALMALLLLLLFCKLLVVLCLLLAISMQLVNWLLPWPVLVTVKALLLHYCHCNCSSGSLLLAVLALASDMHVSVAYE
jgi:hypothetical protein